MKARGKARIPLNLALQGGGAHGAFTWGVLDRILDDPDIELRGISGTSAGAMNGAILCSGYMKGGAKGAQEALRTFWQRISEVGGFGASFEQYNLDQFPLFNAVDMMTRVFSPYQLNPLNINPLRRVLEDMIDLDAMQACDYMHLFVTATAVRSGRPRVFHTHEINVDALLASACIPFIFQAVEIDGEPYWDGGYMGNPVIWPLLYNTDVSDVMLIQINPLHRDDVPKTANDIVNRMNEITFNSSLIAEMRAINFVSRLIRDKRLDPKIYKDVRLHMIDSTDLFHDLNASSKMNTHWDFFQELHQRGWHKADTWLARHKKQIGVEGTVNIPETFLHVPRGAKKPAKQTKKTQQKRSKS